ncbi:MAG: T9SS type A sorting domain-containing protein [Gammaproteobacteria bacterium]|nr:T9SS type A sorting domain-containing protein [Gammaproteobacteria bacterium]
MSKCDSATIYFIVNPIRKDFGDHPAEYATASHYISLDEDGDNKPDVPGTFWLGELVDGELESKKSFEADGDDKDDLNDDDGFIMGDGATLGSDYPVKVIINANQSGIQVHFGLWIDWDNDGVYDDFYKDYGISSSPDTVVVNISIPASVPTGVAHFRTRAFSSAPTASDFGGFFRNGEVEDYKFFVSARGLLPVELVFFKATAEGDDAALQWQTASEVNNDYFSVQRSYDALHWEEITIVDGMGNSTEVVNYRYIDKDLMAGGYYYRLEQFDFDGTSEFSDVEFVQIESGNSSNREMSIYPNPATINSELTFKGLGGDEARVSIYGIDGSVVTTIRLDGLDKISLSQYDLQTGIYLVEVSRETGTDQFKLVVVE